jgi:hypothetical protein
MDIQELRKKGRGIGFLTSVSTFVGMANTTLLMAQVGDDFDPGELVSAGFGSAFLMVFGGYAIFTNRAGLKEKLVTYGFDIKSFLTWSTADQEVDWAELFSKTYKPGRRKYDLPIGISESGELIEIPMRNSEAHLIFSGITGTGKSVLVNQFVLAAAMSGLYQVVIVSLSKKDYQLIEHMQNVHIFSFDGQKFETDGERYRAYSDLLLTTLKDFNAEVVCRQEIVTRYQKRDLHEVRADQRPPAVLLVLEEFTNALEFAGFGLPRAKKSAAKGALIDALQIGINFGRSSMMHLAIIGQRPSGVIPGGVRKQSVNVTTRVADVTEAALATGRKKSGAEQLRVFNSQTGVPGQALVVGSLTNKIVEIPYSPDEIISKLSRTHEDKENIRFAGQPTWMSVYESPDHREVTVTVPLSSATDTNTAQAQADVKEGTAITNTTESGPIPSPTTVGSRSSQVVTPPKRPMLTTDAVVQIFTKQHGQLSLEMVKNTPPTLEQFIALGLFSVAGLPYKQLAGPAIFNGSHEKYFDSAHYTHALITRLGKIFDTEIIQNELRHLTKFYYRGFQLLETPDSLSVSRWVGLGLCVHSQMTQNKSLRAIFGAKNGRYASYFKKAQEFHKLYELAQLTA